MRLNTRRGQRTLNALPPPHLLRRLRQRSSIALHTTTSGSIALLRWVYMPHYCYSRIGSIFAKLRRRRRPCRTAQQGGFGNDTFLVRTASATSIPTSVVCVHIKREGGIIRAARTPCARLSAASARSMVHGNLISSPCLPRHQRALQAFVYLWICIASPFSAGLPATLFS